MNYAESVRFLYSLGNEIQTAKFGLDRITRLLDALGNPHRTGRFVHVAGTNGKGSTSAMIEAGLREAGVPTGLYTSPHLIEPTERIRISGQAVSEDRFAEAFSEVHEISERLERSGILDLHPTYFECVTAMAFLLFDRARVDTAVLEVGLGGRLDATNLVDADVAIVCSIGSDHRDWLGETLEQIGAEKAGIFRHGRPAVLSTAALPASVYAAIECSMSPLNSSARAARSWTICWARLPPSAL